MRCVVLFVALLITTGARAECTDPKATPPNLAQIRAMKFNDLYHWYKLSQRASDTAATTRVLGGKVPDCVQALVDREYDFARELRFR
ncbi:hypothetical protein ABIB89_003186 [Bradyrhizobium sp. JR3.12]